MTFYGAITNNSMKKLEDPSHMKATTGLYRPVLVSGGGIAIVFMLTSFITAAILALKTPSYTQTIRVMEGDTVVLSTIKPSDYSEVVLEEILQADDSDHGIDALLVPCNHLMNHFNSTQFQSRNLTLTSATYEFGEQPANTPIYLLAGSNITYKFRIWTTMSQLMPPQFVIFDNYASYRAFVAGENDENEAIFRQELSVGSHNPEITKINFNAANDGYYFITGYSEAGITYQFNATDNVLYLNESDYLKKYSVCHFSVGVSCSFPTSNSFLGSSAEVCIVAHIYKPLSDDPPSTHIVVNIKKGYDALTLFPPLFACISIVIVILLLMLVLVTNMYRHYKYRVYHCVE